MPLTFRPARSEEAPEYVVLRGRTRQNAFSEEGLRAVGVTAETWGAGIDSGALPGHVCTADGDIVGYCFGDRDSGEIVVVAVLPDFEGQGIGGELLRRTMADLARLGHRRLFLSCSPFPDSRSYGFYRHLGWRSTGTFDPRGDEVLEIHVEPLMSPVFFYGLFMDQALLVKKGLHPEVVGPAVLSGYRIHIGERATLLPSASSRAFGILMELSEREARTLYSEPSVREYRRERVAVRLLASGQVVEADCYNLPRERALGGSNPAYAGELSRLVEALGLDSAYAEEIAAFGTSP